MNLLGISGKKQHGKDTVCQIMQYLLGEHDQEGEFEEYREWMEKNPVETLTAPFAWNGGWKRKLFADKLKDIVCILIGCTRKDLESDTFKNTPLGEEWTKWYYYHTWGLGKDGRISSYFSSEQEALDNYKEVLERFPTGATLTSKVLTPRLMLQLIGTEGLRDLIHPNVHVNALFSDYKPVSTMQLYIEDITGDNVAKFDETTLKATFESYPRWIITDVRFENEAEAIKQRKGIVIRVDNPRVISNDIHPSETSLDEYDNFEWKIVNDGSLEDLIGKVKEMLQEFKLLKNDN